MCKDLLIILQNPPMSSKVEREEIRLRVSRAQHPNFPILIQPLWAASLGSGIL